MNSKYYLIIKAIALLGIVGLLLSCGGGGGGGGDGGGDGGGGVNGACVGSSK